ncbi:hypothetical protein MPEAHAMD_1844 [Methylobacterium frigidaeris]|uniref:Uncharacterized protein n=1 Tax=Methylobacterium frigidaeris TaxID=2038277 RepID=A0AA37HA67_9HYPH|nr:hypothetical protein MPEAHAMD_1844 [Methylobacterium frigidaeris]
MHWIVQGRVVGDPTHALRRLLSLHQDPGKRELEGPNVFVRERVVSQGTPRVG